MIDFVEKEIVSPGSHASDRIHAQS